MRLKDKVAVLEAKTRPQRWAMELRIIRDDDGATMEMLLGLCEVGLFIPMPAGIKAHFEKHAEIWRESAEDEGKPCLNDEQTLLWVVGALWHFYHAVDREFHLPNADELFVALIAVKLSEAVPGANELSDEELKRLALLIYNDDPGDDIANAFAAPLAAVRDAVTAAGLMVPECATTAGESG